jgi:hypothetical protein
MDEPELEVLSFFIRIVQKRWFVVSYAQVRLICLKKIQLNSDTLWSTFEVLGVFVSQRPLAHIFDFVYIVSPKNFEQQYNNFILC